MIYLRYKLAKYGDLILDTDYSYGLRCTDVPVIETLNHCENLWPTWVEGIVKQLEYLRCLVCCRLTPHQCH